MVSLVLIVVLLAMLVGLSRFVSSVRGAGRPRRARGSAHLWGAGDSTAYTSTGDGVAHHGHHSSGGSDSGGHHGGGSGCGGGSHGGGSGCGGSGCGGSGCGGSGCGGGGCGGGS